MRHSSLASQWGGFAWLLLFVVVFGAAYGGEDTAARITTAVALAYGIPVVGLAAWTACWLSLRIGLFVLRNTLCRAGHHIAQSRRGFSYNYGNHRDEWSPVTTVRGTV